MDCPCPLVVTGFSIYYYLVVYYVFNSCATEEVSKEEEEQQNEKGRLTTDETKATGSVSAQVYYTFIKVRSGQVRSG